jgi:hypothetical protein
MIFIILEPGDYQSTSAQHSRRQSAEYPVPYGVFFGTVCVDSCLVENGAEFDQTNTFTLNR